MIQGGKQKLSFTGILARISQKHIGWKRPLSPNLSNLCCQPNIGIKRWLCFYVIADSLCSKLDQERKARCTPQQKLKVSLREKKAILFCLSVMFSFSGVARIKRIILLRNVTDSGLNGLPAEVLHYGLKLISDMSHELRGFMGQDVPLGESSPNRLSTQSGGKGGNMLAFTLK